MVGLPQVVPSAEEADQRKRVQRVHECFVVGVVGVGSGVDGGYQQAVGRVDVTVAVEEEKGRCCCRVQAAL